MNNSKIYYSKSNSNNINSNGNNKSWNLLVMKIVTLIVSSFISASFSVAYPTNLHHSSLRQRSASSTKPLLTIVHLGDSYSSGVGARDLVYGHVNYAGVKNCYRSPTNWGSISAGLLGDLFNVRYINRACGYAVISHIEEKQFLYDVKLPPCPNPDYPGEEIYVKMSNGLCNHYATPQIDAIDQSVNLVLMTMGGNDMHFDRIIMQCYILGLRDGKKCHEVLDDAFSSLDVRENEFTNALLMIKSKLNENAKVIVVSYPHLTLDYEYKIFPDGRDITSRIRDLSFQGDEHQKNAIRRSNLLAGDFALFYDGTKELFQGHEPDPSAFVMNPDRWMNEFDQSIIWEWYHMNSLGHQYLGRSVADFIKSQDIKSDYFQTHDMINQDLVVDASAKPSAWMGTAYAGAIGRDITFDATGSYDPLGLDLVLFEWDFTGDGQFDRNTTGKSTNFTYDTGFDGFAVVRVTSASGATALASARVIVNFAGYLNSTTGTCKLDDNGISTIIDDNSDWVNCIPTSLPKTDIPGVSENVVVPPV